MRTLALQLLRRLVRSLGLQRGIHRLVELLLRDRNEWVLSTDREGNRFLLNLQNYLDARLFIAGAYEADEIKTFRQLIQEIECTTFLDVGANIGLYTISVGKMAMIHQVHAFEPDTLNRYQLGANILLNGLAHKITLHNEALSDINDTATLYRCSQPKAFDAYKANTGAHSFHYNPQWHDDYVLIECRRGDDILSLQNERIAIKIDVEGHEEQVLRGMANVLRQNICVILIESLPPRYPKVANLLNEYGYSLHRTLRDHNFIFTNTNTFLQA